MSSYIAVELKRQVRESFRNSCAYCQTAENLTVAIFEIEHIIPQSEGGKTEFGNLCLACPTCNRYKAVHMLVRDAVSGDDVPLFHPHHDRWAEHFAWNDDSTEVVGLTATGRATISTLHMNRPQIVRVRRMWIAMDEHPPKLE